MKRALYFLIIGALVAVLPAAAVGQSGITWDTEIFIQNVGSDIAYVTVYYYLNISEGGGLHPTHPTDDFQIPLGGSIKFYPGVPAGFNGSAVIESTQPIVVVATEEGDFPDYNSAYEGFDAGSGTVRLPAIMSCNSGFYTFFNVQNAGSESVNVTVEYKPGPGAAARAADTCALDPGEACTLSQEPGSSTKWPACTPGYRWVGGAVITNDKDQPLVATANQVNTDPLLGMGTYSGFAGAGSPTAIAMGVMNKNSRFWSGIAATNAGDAKADITFKFYPTAATPPYPAIGDVVVEDVEPNYTAYVFLPSLVDETWVGAVEVSGGGENVFVMSNLLRETIPTEPQTQLSSYKGVDPNQASDTLYLPAVLSNDATRGWWTAVQVFNTSKTAEANVDIIYSQCPASYCGTAWTPSARKLKIPAWDTIVDFHTTGEFTGKYYFGGAVITSDGPGIVGIVNMLEALQANNGDVTNTYNCTNR